jgi:hypothetical protein
MLVELRDADPDGGGLPRYVDSELAAYAMTGILAHGFTRVRCETCHDEMVVAFGCKQARAAVRGPGRGRREAAGPGASPPARRLGSAPDACTIPSCAFR